MATVTGPVSVGRHTAMVRGRRWLSAKTFELTLARPSNFVFQAGQRIRILGKGLERDYSMVSAETDDHLALCIRLVSGGQLTPFLSRWPPEDPISFTGPHGYLAWQPSGRPVVFVATGTGISPFVAMARSGASGFVLLHGVSDSTELYYGDELRMAARCYVPCLSIAGSEPTGGAFTGKVTDYLSSVLAPGPYDFFLCGRREMIRDATHIIDRRFSGARIYSESFF